MDVEHDDLRFAVESQHSCRAILAQTVPVRETFKGQAVWEGIVHVFNIEGHPEANQAYAWSSVVEGSERRRFFAVLQLGAIKSPVDAVRAAIVAEHKAQPP
jgi:DNA-binding FrmR family transcriptional regulator